ncbi:hypothetical protein D3C77_649800 [compost metagenome]
MSNQGNSQHERLEDTVLQEVGKIEISNTQEYRVILMVDGTTNKTVLSVQKWWRASAKEDWKMGKGFRLDSKTARKLGHLVLDGALELDKLR